MNVAALSPPRGAEEAGRQNENQEDQGESSSDSGDGSISDHGGFVESEDDNDSSSDNDSDEANGSVVDSDSEEDGSEEDNASSDDDDSEDEADENPRMPDDVPLFAGAPITVGQSLIAIMTFALTYSLSGVCISDLLGLFCLHCLPINEFVKSLYKLRKFFNMIGGNVLVFHHYCVECLRLLESKNSVCPGCNGSGEKSYFIEVPLLAQLQAMFKIPGFYDKLQ